MNLYDVTPTDGLELTVPAPDDGFSMTDVDVIGDGVFGLLTDPFSTTVIPLDQRLLAEPRLYATTLC